jgi:hypothetical protein
MSGFHQDRDLICEKFVLEPTDLPVEGAGDEPGSAVEGYAPPHRVDQK